MKSLWNGNQLARTVRQVGGNIMQKRDSPRQLLSISIKKRSYLQRGYKSHLTGDIENMVFGERISSFKTAAGEKKKKDTQSGKKT